MVEAIREQVTVDTADQEPIWQDLVALGAATPKEVWAEICRDLARNLDHYLYGAPKAKPASDRHPRESGDPSSQC